MSTLKVFARNVRKNNFCRSKICVRFEKHLLQHDFGSLWGHFLGTSGRIPGHFRPFREKLAIARLRVASHMLCVTSWYFRYHEAFFSNRQNG